MIKILLVQYPGMTGCIYFRQLQPHTYLDLHYKNFQVENIISTRFLTDDQLKQYSLIQFHKNFVPDKSVDDFSIFDRIKKLGIKIMVDFDDYWSVPQTHRLYNKYKEDNFPERYRNMLKKADYVSVTTTELAEKVKPFNKQVYIFPNALDVQSKLLNPVKTYTDNIMRFGYMGGVDHKGDVALMQGLNTRLIQMKLPYRLYLFGFNKKNQAYIDYANILSDNGQSFDNIKLFEPLKIPEYLMYYNMINVSLVPLENNLFNNLKSELKLIEAGFFRKAVICSNVYPYKSLLKNKVNCLVIEPGDKRWDKKIKYLVQNPGLAKELGENLYLDVTGKFSLEKVTRYRAQVYEQLLA